MAQAVSEAIGQEIERNPDVFVMGEDYRQVRRHLRCHRRPAGQVTARTASWTRADLGDCLHRTGHRRGGRGHAAHRELLMFVDPLRRDMIYNHMAKNIYMAGNIKLPMVLMSAIGGG